MDTTYTKETDVEHKIKVPSQLIYVIWNSRFAFCGEEAEFEVRTSFVGDGAEVKVKGKTEKGKSLGSADGKIYGNRYIGKLAIPTKLKPDDEVYVEVKLPKHNLKDESNRIPARPPILAKKLQWDKKEAGRGDVVTLQGQFDGIMDETDATVIIYEYDKDGNHDPIARIPTIISNKQLSLKWEYEYHEDVDDIPTQEDLKPYNQKYAHPEYFFVVDIDDVRVGVNQESGLLKFKDWIEIKAVEADDTPVPNANYTIKFADGTERKGKTDAEGNTRIENIPPGSYTIIFES